MATPIMRFFKPNEKDALYIKMQLYQTLNFLGGWHDNNPIWYPTGVKWGIFCRDMKYLETLDFLGSGSEKWESVLYFEAKNKRK